MVIGIVRLPDVDSGECLINLFTHVLKIECVEYSWFDVSEIQCDALILSCSDISFTFSRENFPIAKSIGQFAARGGMVFGFGGGFHLLCMMGLLPGQIVENRDLTFVSRMVYLRSENMLTPLTSMLTKEKPLALCVAHRFGRYRATAEELRSIRQNDQIVFRYCDAQGNTSLGVNIDGAVDNIAAIANEYGNVFGMIAHPERSLDLRYNGNDGMLIFESLLAAIS